MKKSILIVLIVLFGTGNLFAQYENWTEQTLPFTSGTVEKLSFFDENNGWAICYDDVQGKVVLRTIDGGTTWDFVDLSAFKMKIRGIWTTDENTCYIIGVNDDNSSGSFRKILIIKTTDSGTTWNSQNIPVLKGYLTDVNFTSETNGVAVGIDNDNKKMLVIYTSDGMNWQKANVPDENVSLQKVVFPNENNGWIVASTTYPSTVPSVYNTSNGGLDWNKVDHPIINGSFCDVSFINENIGWLAGRKKINDENQGFILQTKDGGTTWSNVELNIPVNSAGDTKSIEELRIRTFSFVPESSNGEYRGVLSVGETTSDESSYTVISPITYMNGANKRNNQKDNFNESYSITNPTFFESYIFVVYMYYLMFLYVHGSRMTGVDQRIPAIFFQFFNLSTEKSITIPTSFGLNQNYPNPFNPTTTISYEIPKGTIVKIDIIDLQGKIVNTLLNDYEEPGIHTIKWNGRDWKNNLVQSGTYFYKLKSNGEELAKKMILLH